MGRSKKNLDDIKKDIESIKKEDMKKIVGGKKKSWSKGCGGIVPQ